MPFTHLLPPSHSSNVPKSYLIFKAKVTSLFTEDNPNYLHPSVIFSPLRSFSTFSFYAQFNIKLCDKYNETCNIL